MKKKITILLILICAISITVRAQDDKERNKTIRFGYHLASMVNEGSKPDTAKSLSSFYVGFVRSKNVGSILNFDSGIEYFQNGIRYSGDSKRTLHTVSIPLDLRLKIGPVYALGGAAANIKVSEKYDLGDNSYQPLDTKKSSWFDIAAFAGAGVKILFFSVEARYHWGLLEARNDLYNRYFQLGAALSF